MSCHCAGAQPGEPGFNGTLPGLRDHQALIRVCQHITPGDRSLARTVVSSDSAVLSVMTDNERKVRTLEKVCGSPVCLCAIGLQRIGTRPVTSCFSMLN